MPRRRPPRVAIIGIDGSGKSTAALLSIRALGESMRVCKPGRNAFAQENGEVAECCPRLSQLFERLFMWADLTKRRGVIALTRLLFIVVQGWLEPYMVRRFRPDLVVNTRCMVLDPAVYLGFYFPGLAKRLSVKARLWLAARLSRLPHADLYFLLRTPPPVAMQRIYGRIEKAPGYECQPRDYWLHLHEQEAILTQIAARFDETLAVAGQRAHFDVVDIDTTVNGQDDVARIIVEHVRAWLQGRRQAA